MDYVIEFFRDTLDGPLYIVVVVICVILIFACIGYLAEKSINAKKEKEKYASVGDNEATHSSDTGAALEEVVPNTDVNVDAQVLETPVENVVTPLNEPVETPPVDTTLVTPVSLENKEVTVNTEPMVTHDVIPDISVNSTSSENNNAVSTNQAVSNEVPVTPVGDSVSPISNQDIIPTINQENNK